MTYVIPASEALNFNLLQSPYVAGTADFDVERDPDDVQIIYPDPPSVMSSARLFAPLAGDELGVVDHFRDRQSAPHDVRAGIKLASTDSSYDIGSRHNWDKVAQKDSAASTGQSWAMAQPLEQQTSDGWRIVGVRDSLHGGPKQSWDGSIRAVSQYAPQNFHALPFVDVASSATNIDTHLWWEMPIIVAPAPAYVPGVTTFNLTGSPYVIPAVFDFNLDVERTAPVTVLTRPVYSRFNARGWGNSEPQNINYRHPWDFKPRKNSGSDFGYVVEPPLPSKPPAPLPEFKEAYHYMNSSSLKKMPEGIPLEFADLSISLDIDSFSWALSCRILNEESMAHIKPGPSGPVEVEATVNNKVWRFMVEKYTEERKFPKVSYRVTGSSLTQLLADPYSAKQSAQIITPTNAQQVIQTVLDLTGFSVVWDASLADYTIPAGVWGYENKTPIEVIDELVKAAGGILIPDMSAPVLYAKHRYADGAPWQWQSIDSSQLDFVIADSMIYGLSSQWQPGRPYNAVYVSGVSAGVAVSVVRSGTAGDAPAADVYDNLNLTTQQCRGRGISILGQEGNQEVMSIEVPVPTSGAPGLVIPGKWGEVQYAGAPESSWRALALSTQVSVSKPGAARAIQTLRLERHHY